MTVSVDWSFPPPKVIAGALPRTGVHYLLNSATPVVLAATIADMATSVASSIVDQPLRAVPGSQRRSPAGFLGSRGSLAPEAVAILNARIGLDMGEAIQAAALARGVTRPLDVAVTALSGGSLVATPDAARRLHDLDEFLPADIGLIIIIDNFAGTREGDAEMVRAVLAIASSFANNSQPIFAAFFLEYPARMAACVADRSIKNRACFSVSGLSVSMLICPSCFDGDAAH